MNNDYLQELGFSTEEDYKKYISDIRRQIQDEDYLENQSYDPDNDDELQAVVSRLDSSSRSQYKQIESKKLQNRNDIDSIKRYLHKTANAMLESQETSKIHRNNAESFNPYALTKLDTKDLDPIAPAEILLLNYIQNKAIERINIPKYFTFEYKLDIEKSITKLYSFELFELSSNSKRFQLTNTGTDLIKDNQHLLFFQQHKNQIPNTITLERINTHRKNSKNENYLDDFIELLTIEAINNYNSKQFGLYRNCLLSLSEIYKAAEDYLTQSVLLLYVCHYDKYSILPSFTRPIISTLKQNIDKGYVSLSELKYQFIIEPYIKLTHNQCNKLQLFNQVTDAIDSL